MDRSNVHCAFAVKRMSSHGGADALSWSGISSHRAWPSPSHAVSDTPRSRRRGRRRFSKLRPRVVSLDPTALNSPRLGLDSSVMTQRT